MLAAGPNRGSLAVDRLPLLGSADGDDLLRPGKQALGRFLPSGDMPIRGGRHDAPAHGVGTRGVRRILELLLNHDYASLSPNPGRFLALGASLFVERVSGTHEETAVLRRVNRRLMRSRRQSNYLRQPVVAALRVVSSCSVVSP